MTAGRVVILLGAPGSGKGTQAARLSERLGIPHVATGDLLRENISRETEIGRGAKSFLDAGELVPDEVVTKMVLDRVSEPDCARGFLLDGYPRTIPQAESLEAELRKGWAAIVVLIRVGESTLVDRAAGRLICRSCGKVHHAQHHPPAVAGRCDRCGGELHRRRDDSPEVVRGRLAVYRRETQPLVAFYRARGLLREIDGERSMDEVFAELEQLVGRAA